MNCLPRAPSAVLLNILFLYKFQNPVVCPKAVDRSLKVAELLIAQGCDPSAPDEEKQSPLMCAVEQVLLDFNAL